MIQHSIADLLKIEIKDDERILRFEKYERWSHRKMDNKCFRCHKQDYETTSDHWHYCNDCVKVCSVCKELKVLWAFNFDFTSAEWKRWKASNCFGFTSASGHTPECTMCVRDIEDSLGVKTKPVIQKTEFVMTPEMLKLMQDAIQGTPGAAHKPPGDT